MAKLEKPLRDLWRQVRSCHPPSLGPALLSQDLQGQLPCESRQGPCPPETVARLAHVAGPQIRLQHAVNGGGSLVPAIDFDEYLVKMPSGH
jgi:hypothetical protein